MVEQSSTFYSNIMSLISILAIGTTAIDKTIYVE